VVLKVVDETRCDIDPAATLSAAHPLYAVDLDQRITSWNDEASAQLNAGDEVIGRRCYEVLASMDIRNASICRPNCPVISMARIGRPSRDFEVWTQASDGDSGRVQVSILVQEADDPAQSRVLHMVRRVQEATAPAAGTRGVAQVVRTSKRQAGPVSPELQHLITPRQIAALRLLAEGYSPEEIAGSLGIRPITIRNHIQAAMDRLGARTRLEAVIIASRAGLLGDTV
jgi:DNA-binding CsgD family transcriptional regulator